MHNYFRTLLKAAVIALLIFRFKRPSLIFNTDFQAFSASPSYKTELILHCSIS